MNLLAACISALALSATANADELGRGAGPRAAACAARTWIAVWGTLPASISRRRGGSRAPGLPKLTPAPFRSRHSPERAPRARLHRATHGSLPGAGAIGLHGGGRVDAGRADLAGRPFYGENGARAALAAGVGPRGARVAPRGVGEGAATHPRGPAAAPRRACWPWWRPETASERRRSAQSSASAWPASCCTGRPRRCLM